MTCEIECAKDSNQLKGKKSNWKTRKSRGAGLNNLTFVYWWAAGGRGATLYPYIYNIFFYGH